MGLKPSAQFFHFECKATVQEEKKFPPGFYVLTLVRVSLKISHYRGAISTGSVSPNTGVHTKIVMLFGK